jgi:hypothetical protein
LHGLFPATNNSALSEVRNLLRPETRAQIPAESLNILQQALEDGLQDAFFFVAVATLIAIFVAARVSAQRPATTKLETEPSTQLAHG